MMLSYNIGILKFVFSRMHPVNRLLLGADLYQAFLAIPHAPIPLGAPGFALAKYDVALICRRHEESRELSEGK